MTPIPPEVSKTLEGLRRMKRCELEALQGVYELCDGKIEWHHVWIYGGRQIQEVWAIVAGCHHHHDMVGKQQAVRMAFEAASLQEATDEDLAKYPRKDWKQIKKSLGL
jgi:hypothetical protein